MLERNDLEDGGHKLGLENAGGLDNVRVRAGISRKVDIILALQNVSSANTYT